VPARRPLTCVFPPFFFPRAPHLLTPPPFAKCAGSTTNALLLESARLCGLDACLVPSGTAADNSGDPASPDKPFKCNTSAASLVLGHQHHGLAPRAAARGLPAAYVTVLRHPLARVHSLLRYVARSPGHYLHAEVRALLRDAPAANPPHGGGGGGSGGGGGGVNGTGPSGSPSGGAPGSGGRTSAVHTGSALAAFVATQGAAASNSVCKRLCGPRYGALGERCGRDGAFCVARAKAHLMRDFAVVGLQECFPESVGILGAALPWVAAASAAAAAAGGTAGNARDGVVAAGSGSMAVTELGASVAALFSPGQVGHKNRAAESAAAGEANGEAADAGNLRVGDRRSGGAGEHLLSRDDAAAVLAANEWDLEVFRFAVKLFRAQLAQLARAHLKASLQGHSSLQVHNALLGDRRANGADGGGLGPSGGAAPRRRARLPKRLVPEEVALAGTAAATAAATAASAGAASASAAAVAAVARAVPGGALAWCNGARRGTLAADHERQLKRMNKHGKGATERAKQAAAARRGDVAKRAATGKLPGGRSGRSKVGSPA